MERRVNVISLESFDSEHLQDAVKDSGLQHLQLSGGKFHGRLTRCLMDDMTLDSGVYDQDVLARGIFPANRITLGFILSSSRPGYLNGTRLGHHDLVVFAEGGIMDAYTMPAGTQWVTCQIPRKQLERHDISLPARSQVKRYPGLSRVSMKLAVQLISAYHPFIGWDSATRPAWQIDAKEVVQTFVSAFHRIHDTFERIDLRTHRLRGHQRARVLRSVEDYIRHHLSGDLRIGDLCDTANVSQRSLEYLFKDYYGVTPQRYLTLCRLHAVRERLIRLDPQEKTVAEIAASYGFKHAGRFSQTYMKVFDELPSETLSEKTITG